MSKPVREVLYDTEAALRQVDSVLLDMTGESADLVDACDGDAHPAPDLRPCIARIHQVVGELDRAFTALSTDPALFRASDADTMAHAAAVLSHTEERLAQLLHRVTGPHAAAPSRSRPRD